MGDDDIIDLTELDEELDPSAGGREVFLGYANLPLPLDAETDPEAKASVHRFVAAHVRP